MKKFEYRTVRINKKEIDDDVLNIYGDEGWELINMGMDGNQIYILTFKRESK